jgi:Tol biopolymer transport system component
MPGYDTSLGGGEDAFVVKLGPGYPMYVPMVANGLFLTRMGFVSQRGGQDEIYVIKPDGSAPVKLTAGVDPAWSSDGNRLAFASGTGVLSVMNMDGTGLLQLTNQDAWQPPWSPDAASIAFMSSISGTRQIYKVASSGGDAVRLTSNSLDDRTPSWSPDGQKIAFTSNRSGRWQIWVMNADGTNQTMLTSAPVDHYRPVWSPDGRRMAFGVWTGQRYEIWVMNSDGTNPTAVMTNAVYKQEGTGYGLAWAPSE